MRQRTKRRNAIRNFRRRAQRTVRTGRRNLRNGDAQSVCRNGKSLQLLIVKMCIGLNCVVLIMVMPQIHSPRMNGKFWHWLHNMLLSSSGTLVWWCQWILCPYEISCCHCHKQTRQSQWCILWGGSVEKVNYTDLMWDEVKLKCLLHSRGVESLYYHDKVQA